jgi:hypothetical protein
VRAGQRRGNAPIHEALTGHGSGGGGGPTSAPAD